MEYIFLFIAAVLGGALNAVAGGGSFFTFPMLLFTGMNPIIANATNTMALWPGTVASVAAYRKEIVANKQHLPMLMATSFIGSLLGTFVLLSTSASTFAALVPYLLLFATLLFTFSGNITQAFRRIKGFQLTGWKSIAVQLVIAFYGGYFGGGMGILMLALLSLMGFTNIHEMNGLKTVLGTVINGIAVVVFVVAKVIAWPQAIVMLIGAILGGYAAAHYARMVPTIYVRRIVIVSGFALSLYFFVKG